MSQAATPTPLAAGEPNAVSRMLGLLGDEWNLLIVQQALLGATRYNEFLTRLPISNAVLTDRLRTLLDEYLLERVLNVDNPQRAPYRLTPRGASLWPVLVALWEWERRWVLNHRQPLPAMQHVACNREFAPVLVCAACAQPCADGDVRVRWGPSGSWERSVPTTLTRRRGSSQAGSGRSVGLFPETMSVFGNRWSAAILIAAFLGATRFGDFQTQLGAPPGSLSTRLRTFVDYGVLTSNGEYRLTEKGRAFYGVLVLALQWAQRWFTAAEGPAVVLTHRDCANTFKALLICDQCLQPLAANSVTAG